MSRRHSEPGKYAEGHTLDSDFSAGLENRDRISIMSSKLDEAHRLLEEGNRCHREGDIDAAIENYKKSIELDPSADAHTYLGWMYSFQGHVEEAIEHCRTAIELDPDFGNPYNDIGVYLMQKGRIDEAEPWFRRAMEARRYEPRQFPHLNMGHIHVARKEYGKALNEFRRALHYAPHDPIATAAFQDLVGKLN